MPLQAPDLHHGAQGFTRDKTSIQGTYFLPRHRRRLSGSDSSSTPSATARNRFSMVTRPVTGDTTATIRIVRGQLEARAELAEDTCGYR